MAKFAQLLLPVVIATALFGCVSTPTRPENVVVDVVVNSQDSVSFEGKTLTLEELPACLRRAGVNPRAEIRVRFPDINNRQQIAQVYKLLMKYGYNRVMPVGERQISSHVEDAGKSRP